ncbi:MAG: hypothetical protein AB1894_13820 [Chloroflexota bacterium]
MSELIAHDPGAAPSAAAIWPAVWKLMRLRLVIMISGFRRARLRAKIGTVVLGLFFLGLLAGAFAVSWFILRALRSPELSQYVGDMTPLLQSVPVLLVGGAFVGVLLTSFGVLLQALYLAGDMDFLLSAPLPIRAVFLTKLLQAILPNFGLICLFALPVLFGLGISGSYNILYYPLVILVLVALALAAAGLSSLLVMLVVRIFPARRVAEVLGFLGATISFLCSQSGQFARFSEPSPEQAAQAIQAFERLNNPWLPLAWAGRGLIDIGEGRWLPGLLYLGLTLGACGLAFVLALNTAERLYYTGWASMQARAQKKKKVARSARAARPAPLVSLAERRIPPALRAIIVKDWLVLRRDLRNMSQLVTPLILGIVYAFMFLRGGGEMPTGRGEAPELVMQALGNAALYANVGISLFVGWMLLGRLAGMGFSQEGKNYWIIKVAPIGAGTLIIAKFLVAYLPVVALSWLFLLVMWLIQRPGLGMLLFALPVIALSIAGNAGINLTFGITGANMKWDDPRHMQRGSASCLGALFTMLYLPLNLLLFFGPPILFAIFNLSETLGQLVGLALGGIFSLLCTILPLWLVRQRVVRLGED